MDFVIYPNLLKLNKPGLLFSFSLFSLSCVFQLDNLRRSTSRGFFFFFLCIHTPSPIARSFRCWMFGPRGLRRRMRQWIISASHLHFTFTFIFTFKESCDRDKEGKVLRGAW